MDGAIIMRRIEHGKLKDGLQLEVLERRGNILTVKSTEKQVEFEIEVGEDESWDKVGKMRLITIRKDNGLTVEVEYLYDFQKIQADFISDSISNFYPSGIFNAFEPLNREELEHKLRTSYWTNANKKTIKSKYYHKAIVVYGTNGKIQLSDYAISLVDADNEL